VATHTGASSVSLSAAQVTRQPWVTLVRICWERGSFFRKQHTLNPRRGSTRAVGAGWCLSTRHSPFSSIVALRQQSPPGATPKGRPKVRDAAAPVPEVGRLPDAVAVHDGGHQPAQNAAVLEVVPLAGRVARVLIHGDGGADEEPLPVRGCLCPGLSAVRQRRASAPAGGAALSDWRCGPGSPTATRSMATCYWSSRAPAVGTVGAGKAEGLRGRCFSAWELPASHSLALLTQRL